MATSRTDKEIKELTEELDALAEALEKKERDKVIAKRFEEDEDRMNSVQYTNWDFRG